MGRFSSSPGGPGLPGSLHNTNPKQWRQTPSKHQHRFCCIQVWFFAQIWWEIWRLHICNKQFVYPIPCAWKVVFPRPPFSPTRWLESKGHPIGRWYTSRWPAVQSSHLVEVLHLSWWKSLGGWWSLEHPQDLGFVVRGPKNHPWPFYSL